MDEFVVRISRIVKNVLIVYLFFAFGCGIWKLINSHGVVNDSVKLPFAMLICLIFPVLKFDKLLRTGRDITALQVKLSFFSISIAFCMFFIYVALSMHNIFYTVLFTIFALFFYSAKFLAIYADKNNR